MEDGIEDRANGPAAPNETEEERIGLMDLLLPRRQRRRREDRANGPAAPKETEEEKRG
jgi:hypothetical protein